MDAVAIGHNVLMFTLTSSPICVRIRPAVLGSGSVSILSSLVSVSRHRFPETLSYKENYQLSQELMRTFWDATPPAQPPQPPQPAQL